MWKMSFEKDGATIIEKVVYDDSGHCIATGQEALKAGKEIAEKNAWRLVTVEQVY